MRTSGNVLALEHNSLRYNWNRWGMGLELGIVREGEDADLHIGGALRPLIQPFFKVNSQPVGMWGNPMRLA